MNKLLDLLETNPGVSLEDMSAYLNRTEEDVAKELDNLKKSGILLGAKSVIDWSKIDQASMRAMILLNVRPEKGLGFDSFAKHAALLEEVETVELMSGTYDFLLVVKGKNFTDIANFVAKRLSPLDNVLTTNTCFVLKTYKKDAFMFDNDKDMRIEN